MPRRLKVLLTKSALDAHDRGLRVIAHALRDAGNEVVFTRFELPQEVVKAAQEEDVDAIGISSFMGAHGYFVEEIVGGLKERGLGHIRVVLGGIIPDGDKPRLLEAGVARIFPPGTSPQEVTDFLSAEAGES
jgi:methylmalonyl-CoA mutase C-terminal domain/subunit